jgi:hypothetical protein
MITAKGLFDDFKAIDADATLTDYQKISAKLEKLAKVVLNCRTNEVAIMDFLKIPKSVAPKKEEIKQ